MLTFLSVGLFGSLIGAVVGNVAARRTLRSAAATMPTTERAPRRWVANAWCRTRSARLTESDRAWFRAPLAG